MDEFRTLVNISLSWDTIILCIYTYYVLLVIDIIVNTVTVRGETPYKKQRVRLRRVRKLTETGTRLLVIGERKFTGEK